MRYIRTVRAWGPWRLGDMRKVIWIVLLLLMSAGLASASATDWRIVVKIDDGSGALVGGEFLFGVSPGALDGPDAPINDEEAVYRTDLPQTSVRVVGIIPGATGKTYIRDIRAGNQALPKSYDIMLAAMPSTPATPMRLRFFTTGSQQPRIVPEPSGTPVRYRLVMVDNKGRPGAPANGTSWILPMPQSVGTGIPFYTMPVNLPPINLSAPTHDAMIKEGYLLRFIQEADVRFPVMVNQTRSQEDPTSASPINFAVVFDHPVADFTPSCVSITGTAGGTKTVSITDSGDHMRFNVAVSGMTTTGTVIASIPTAVVHDAAGSTNAASNSRDSSVSFLKRPTGGKILIR